MPVKRKSRGRSKGQKGRSSYVQCGSCGQLVPRDKATDHGTYLGEHGYLGKRPHLYEEVSHIPLIIRMPDSENTEPGRCDALVQPPDIAPTLLDLANPEKPESLEGISLESLVRGEEEWKRNLVVSSQGLVPVDGAHANARRMTVTSKEWALIAVRPDISAKDELEREVKSELYHLQTDPTQTRNLYDERKDVAQKLHASMINFLESIKTSKEILNLWSKPAA